LLAGRADATGFWIADSSRVNRAVAPEGQALLLANSQPKSMAYGAAVQYSVPVLFDDLLAMGRLSYTRLDQQRMLETGAAAFDLDALAQTYSSGYGQIGARWSHVYAVGADSVMVPDVSIGVREQFGSLSMPVDITPQNAYGPNFAISGAKTSPIAGVFGFGVTAPQRDGVSLYLHIDARVAGGEREGVASIGAQIPF
jgi:hypothetical protein